MSVFVRKDPRLLACADPSWAAALWAMLRRHVCVAVAIAIVFAIAYAANVAAGLYAAAQDGGSIANLPVYAPVRIVRDARGIPHVRAGNMHDLFFAQGFAEASDRLFEMDLTRRYAYGRLAEVFGAKALDLDERMRAPGIAAIAEREWRRSDAPVRRALIAFSAGVNAAERDQPLPVEFRMLLYRPAPWTPQDSIAVSLVAALELGDSWYDVIARDERERTVGAQCFADELPLSDPRYDVSVDGRSMERQPPASPPNCNDRSVALLPQRARAGSNAWAAGARKTASHHALVANDPHVDLTIPGIWYAVDLSAPGFHAAGAVIPGLPGVALGHNERIAWAVTNAEAATSVVYRTTHPPARSRVTERFGVRFAKPVTQTYYRTSDAFSIDVQDASAVYLVRWPAYAGTTPEISTLLDLDRASTIATATRALSRYGGAPQNFILGDASGAIAYHMAGAIYDDRAWGRYVHPASDLAERLRIVPFSQLPSHAASRDGILLTANNRTYAPGYRYRLSAAFEPPYRAHRIVQLLHARRSYDAAYFARMQMDACSPIDAEIARDLTRMTRSAALAHWDGCFDGKSTAASLEHGVLDDLLEQSSSFAQMMERLRDPQADPDGIAQTASYALHPIDEPRRWAQAGQVSVEHPLSPAWYGLLRGAPFPGDGDEYTIHLQEPGFAQGLRAVWDVGNWDAGGIVLPSGESGEPGSGHYDDLAKTWIAGTLVPLPFSRDAVARATVKTLVLTPVMVRY